MRPMPHGRGVEGEMSVTLIKDRRVPKSGRSRAQDVDRYVGMRMRERRIMLGLTQQQMAELIGVTYQQAHKYEKGINRIAGRPALPHRPGAGRRRQLLLRRHGAEQGSSRHRSSGCCSSSPATSSACRAAGTRRPYATWPAPWPMPR